MSPFPDGWHNDPVLHERTRRQMGLPTMSQAAPYLLGAEPKDLLLYKAWSDVLGQYPAYPAQRIGDCESFGNGHGNDLGQCIERSIDGKDTDFLETSTEALYGAGREAGNMLGWQDGCYGSAMVKAMTTIGMVPRELVGSYDGNRAKQWGHDGIPSDIRAAAAAFKLGSAALVSTVEEADAALAAFCPIAISSNVGFTGGRNGFNRDSQGICEQGGSWGHCMLIVGRILSDGTDTYVIAQSWGDQGQPGGPQPFDLPKFCFRARRAVCARILGQNDSYALNAAPAFKHRPVPSHWTLAESLL